MAALPWPQAAVKNLQVRLARGICPAPNNDRLLQDVCTAYGLKNRPARAPRITLKKPNSSLLILEQQGQLIKVQRTENEREYVVNEQLIDVSQAKSQSDLRKLFESALAIKTSRYSLLIPSAYAAPLDPAIPALIQQLVNETHQLASCDFYLEFGRKCMEGMKKVQAEIDVKKRERAQASNHPNGFVQMEGRASELTQLTYLNGELNVLSERLEGTVFPSLEGYDTVRMCAVKKDSSKVDEIQGNAEKLLKNCREDVARITKATGGIREAQKTEGLATRMWNRLWGKTVATTTMPSAPSGLPSDQEAVQ